MDKKIISISGLVGSGKDTVASYLIDNYHFTKLSFAGALKDSVSVIFNWDRTLLEGETLESRQWREQVDHWWAKRLNMPHLTPRWVLQYWGTEVCRTGFHKDIWVSSLENKLNKIQGNVVITDTRFINEFDIIKMAGGVTTRVFRGANPEWYNVAESYTKTKDSKYLDILTAKAIHASEYSSVGLNYDHFLDNNSTLADLYNKIDLIINL